MKAHTKEFKENIAKFGRELDSKITYTINGVTTELGNEELNSVSPHYEGAILKSVMKQLDIDSNVEIPVGTVVNYQLGIKVGNSYEYIDYGNYIVKEVEKQEDTRSYKITCYDKMLYSMTEYKRIIGKNLFDKDNVRAGYRFGSDGNYFADAGHNATEFISVEPSTKYSTSWTMMWDEVVCTYDSTQTFVRRISSGSSFTTSSTEAYIRADVTDAHLSTAQIEKGNTATSYRPYFKYPTTIRNYIDAICYDLGIDFANYNDNFANYDKQISSELYLSYDNETDTYSSLNYTFRDVLDELAQVTASTICIDEETDELEIRYINKTKGKQLVDYENMSRNGAKCTFENNVLKINSVSGTYNHVYYDILDDVKNNPGRKVKFVYESVDLSNFTGSNSTIIQLQITDNGTNSWRILATKNTNTSLTLYTTTIPNDTSNITVARIRIYTNNSNTANTDSVAIITKPLICFDDESNEYEPYGDTIDEEYLKDVNVNFGEMFGAVNTIVLSRSADADNIYYPSTLPSNPIEIKIADNQIMNGNDRDTYMADIYSKLNGLYYYINDYSSTGICYYNLCDRYNVKIGNEFYSCIMLNDSVNVTQGLEEQVYVDMPEETNTDYTKADSTDRKINTAYIIANKAEASIQEVTRQIDNVSGALDEVITTQDATSRTISIITTNIDAETGEVNEVTTKEKRFTLNDSGLIITNSDTNFKSQQDETGTYYYDGENVIGQYTKDGSKQKDLQLFGVYYYGMDDKDDTPMFVTQLYTDNGEECVGHFYNGGDY